MDILYNIGFRYFGYRKYPTKESVISLYKKWDVEYPYYYRDLYRAMVYSRLDEEKYLFGQLDSLQLREMINGDGLVMDNSGKDLLNNTPRKKIDPDIFKGTRTLEDSDALMKKLREINSVADELHFRSASWAYYVNLLDNYPIKSRLWP